MSGEELQRASGKRVFSERGLSYSVGQSTMTHRSVGYTKSAMERSRTHLSRLSRPCGTRLENAYKKF